MTQEQIDQVDLEINKMKLAVDRQNKDIARLAVQIIAIQTTVYTASAIFAGLLALAIYIK